MSVHNGKQITKEEGEAIKSSLSYSDGKLFWSVTRSNRAKVGKEAGYVHRDGARYVHVCGRTYQAHRIIYFLHHGVWPNLVVDHINGDRLDNRPENLRLVTQGQNLKSYASVRKNKYSDYRGVSSREDIKGYRARVQDRGISYHLGIFHCEKEAALAWNYKAAELGFNPEAFNKVFEDHESPI